MELMLRDGTLYFFTIFGVNLMNTLIYFVSGILKWQMASVTGNLSSAGFRRFEGRGR
jgi:hypothetical protein